MRGGRGMKWLPLAVVALLAVLVVGDVLSGRQALVAGVLLEVLLWGIAGLVVVRAVRARRGGQAGGRLEDALNMLLPGPVARVVRLEPLVFLCVWRWVRRQRPQGPDVFPYAKRSPLGALLIVVLLTLPVELLLVELLVPWGWLRLLLFVGAVYAAFWVLGLYASLGQFPHRVSADGLVLHYGLLNTLFVPWRLLDAVALERATAPKAGDGLQVDTEQAHAWLAVGGRTDLRLTLREPLPVERLLGLAPPVRSIAIAADDPERLAAALIAGLVRGAAAEREPVAAEQ